MSEQPNELSETLERYFTAEEVAHRLKVHVETVRRWFRQMEGVLQFGSTATADKRQRLIIRIPASVLERALREKTVRKTRSR